MQNKRLTLERAFNAPLRPVWEAWTDSAILDQWWAPKPYRTETITMEFKVGGIWHYAMIGPKGDKHLCKVTFTAIEPFKSISSTDVINDEAGHANPAFAVMFWKVSFSETNGVTTVTTEISFDTVADMETMVRSGLREGYSMAQGNLEAYLTTVAK